MPQFLIPIIEFIGANVVGGSVGSLIWASAATIANATLLVGGLAYSAMKQRQAKQNARDQYNAAQVDRLTNASTTVAPRELVMGRVKKAGAAFYKASSGADSRDFYIAVAIAGHEIDAIEEISFNDVPVTVDGSGNVTSAPYVGIATIKLHTGAPGQTVDTILNSAFPSAWGSNNVVQGVAYLACRFNYNESAYANGPPAVTVVMRGAKLFDPRTGLTAWSDNPALMMRHVYQHASFGKATVSASEDARFIAAANACDTATNYVVGGVTQTNKLFRGSIVIPFGAQPKSAFDDLIQAMAGSWAMAGGELYLKVGVWSASVMPLTDADLAVIQRVGKNESQVPINISIHQERARKFNTVKAKIWDQGQGYKLTVLTPLVGAALLARDGASLVQDITFPAIGYAPQALHVAGVMMRDARDSLTVELPFKMKVYPVELFDTIDLTLARYGWVNKTFMVIMRQIAADGTVKLTLKETAAAVSQLDAGFLAQGYATNTNLPSPFNSTVISTLTISSGASELYLQSDGTVVSRMKVSWPVITDLAVTSAGDVEVQYRRTATVVAWSSILVAGDQGYATISDVLDSAEYEVRARCNTSLSAGPWSTIFTHSIVGKSTPPPSFDLFLINSQPDGTRQYNFGYSGLSSKPADWLGAEIRYVSGTTGSPDWATMTPLQDIATYYTSSPVELNAPLAGVYTFAIKSRDTTGNTSAYLVRNITLPDRRLGNVFDEFFEKDEGWVGVKTGVHVQSGVLEANDSVTWDAAPAPWSAWTRWNTTPTSPITYETPGRDLGVVVSGQINTTVDADGTLVQELATSANGSLWSGWSAATGNFTARFVKLRLTVTATGPAPVPLIRQFDWRIVAPLKNEYINDQVISGYTGSYRIGTGDVRIPLQGAYSILKRIQIVIQDGSAGTWSWQRLDNVLTYGPRIQFKLNGVLADPAFVDFFVEGF